MLREVWWQGAEEPEREVQNVYQELIPRQYTSSHYEHSKKAVILYPELPFRGVLFVVGTLLNLLRPLVSKAAVGDVLQELLRRFRKSIGASGRLCLLLLIFSMFNAEEYRNTVWFGKKASSSGAQGLAEPCQAHARTPKATSSPSADGQH